MGVESLRQLVDSRAEELRFYSPYHFLRQLSEEHQQQLFGAGKALSWEQDAHNKRLTLSAAQAEVQWLLQYLPWDSSYFGTPMLRLFTGLFKKECKHKELVVEAEALRQHLANQYGAFYAFSIVPAEDVRLLQGLTGGGWHVVESRLTYYHNQLPTFQYPLQPVRAATIGEANHIGQIAAAARNPYDRVHADAWFGQARADAYLATYAENTVTTNLAATVLVPNVSSLPVDSFLAISDLEKDASALGTRLSRVLLTAVGPANRGWHVKLVAETLRRGQAQGHEAVLMTTQSTNHAVFKTCEKLGFRLGAISHVLACHSL